MFSIQEVFEVLKPMLDTNLIAKGEEGHYLVDGVNNFGFGLDFPEGITIFFIMANISTRGNATQMTPEHMMTSQGRFLPM